MLIENLPNGRIRLVKKGQTLTVLEPSSPNNRLIRSSKRRLVEMGVKCKIVDANRDAKIILTNSSNRLSVNERVIVQSRPVNGLSYVHCTVLNSSRLEYLEDQLSVNFIAVDSSVVVDKLIKYGFVKLHKDKKCDCEYHLGCTGLCKKGGENA